MCVVSKFVIGLFSLIASFVIQSNILGIFMVGHYHSWYAGIFWVFCLFLPFPPLPFRLSFFLLDLTFWRWGKTSGSDFLVQAFPDARPRVCGHCNFPSMCSVSVFLLFIVLKIPGHGSRRETKGKQGH